MQNWPAPRVSDPAYPVAISAGRAAAAPGRMTTGLTEPSSPKNGIGTGRSAQILARASPPRTDPVNPAAAMAGCCSSRTPAGTPYTTANVPGGAPAPASASGHDLGGQHRGLRVPLVRLDHHRAAGRQRGRGIPARHREREREVGRGEHRDRADRVHHVPQPGHPGGRRAGDHVQVAAVGQHVAEHPQLAGGAGHLTGQPGGAQRGLGVGQRGQFRGPRVQRVGHRGQRLGPARRPGCGPRRGRPGGRRGRRVHRAVAGLRDRLAGGLPGPRVVSLDHRLPVLLSAPARPAGPRRTRAG